MEEWKAGGTYTMSTTKQHKRVNHSPETAWIIPTDMLRKKGRQRNTCYFGFL